MTKKEAARIARKIAAGHAFHKHVTGNKEFGYELTRKEFAFLIEVALSRFTLSKQLPHQRRAFWNEPHGLIVITNPDDSDGGTAYVPRRGLRDYLKIQMTMNISLSNSGERQLRLPLSGAELLLLHQTMASAAYGIRLNDFQIQVGAPEERMEAIIEIIEAAIDRLPHDENATPLGDVELDFAASDGKALRNALELVMSDLGHEEFSTRTGFSLEEAAQILDQLNAALIAPLHIESRRRAMGHQPQTANEPQAATSR